jgi:stage II sporulation protein M
LFAMREIIEHLKALRHYLALSTIVLLAGVVVGGTNQALDAFIQGQVDGIRQIADSIEASSNPTLLMMVFIFFNNAIKALLVMYLGAFFGIVPVVFLAINGMILGYVVQKAAEKGGGVLFDVLFKGLLPHGILEIPAIIIACAYGLRMGQMMLRGAWTLVVPKSGWGRELEQLMVRTLPAMVVIVGMLLVAAVIESTVTVWLLSL